MLLRKQLAEQLRACDIKPQTQCCTMMRGTRRTKIRFQSRNMHDWAWTWMKCDVFKCQCCVFVLFLLLLCCVNDPPLLSGRCSSVWKSRLASGGRISSKWLTFSTLRNDLTRKPYSLHLIQQHEVHLTLKISAEPLWDSQTPRADWTQVHSLSLQHSLPDQTRAAHAQTGSKTQSPRCHTEVMYLLYCIEIN